MYLNLERRLVILQKKLKYFFKDVGLLKEALTHSSFANENRYLNISSNERLEFLGDSILNAVISQYLFKNCPKYSEGDLTKIRASIVCEYSLAKKAKELELNKYILLGKGEQNSGGRNRTSILADAFEALIGAVFVDGGFDNASKFVLDQFSNIISDTLNGLMLKDFKTLLQEYIQKSYHEKLRYETISESGPEHDKTFFVRVLLGEKILGNGRGKSKKEAEQEAAKNALCFLGVDVENGKRV